MPRFLYWTILIGDQATSFRAREAADLRPTLVQLRRTHPDATMKWFERGRLWASPEEARAAREAERRTARSRPSTWRPGGRHEDPRQKYKDAKKAKWTRFKDRIRQRHDERRSKDAPAEPAAPSSERDRATSDAPRVRKVFRPKPADSSKRFGGSREGGPPSSSRPPRKPRKG